MTITITLPLPDRILSPNHTVGSRGGRMAKATAIKKARTLAKVECMSSFASSFKPRWKTAVVQVTWYAKTIAFPDGDNALASLKAFFDGLTDYGIFDDDRGNTYPPVQFAKDKDNPRIVLTITGA